MTSLDVENLFSNIPLHETIQICLNYLFPLPHSLVLGLNRKFFQVLLEHSVLNSFFIFSNRLYKQIEGLGMGLPLGPTFANIFMCFHEKQWLADCPSSFKPVFYRRYIDDTFVLFKNRSHAKLFLDYLNKKHCNIKFTMECETNDALPFLDTKVCRRNNAFDTAVYRKPTFTGLGMSFFSYCCDRFKINAIKTLLFRAYNISSNYFIMHDEFKFLENYFINNGFPKCLFIKNVKNFLSMALSGQTLVANVRHSDAQYFSLPFFGPQSEKLKHELRILLKKYFPHVDFKIVLTNNFRIRSMFKFKDALPLCARTAVIYKYQCSQCSDATYIGSTYRTFHTRLSEHKGVSSRTGARLTAPPHSAVRHHAEHTCSTAVLDKNFTILDYCANDKVSLRILESLYIFKQRPILNDTDSSFPLNIIK